MTAFDQNKAYSTQEEVFFDDGREIELLHFVYDKPGLDDIRGSPQLPKLIYNLARRLALRYIKPIAKLGK